MSSALGNQASVRKVFVLGVGAQKAGTSWLHGYIGGDQNFRKGFVTAKEFHVWDRKDLELLRADRRQFRKANNSEKFALTLMEKVGHFYFQYFRYLLRKGGIAADITPSYAGLSAERFRNIRQGFAQIDIDMKCVFLMRDPVDRCLSAFNMNRRLSKPGRPRESVRRDVEVDQAFEEYFTSEHCRMRTTYGDTIARLEAGFSSNQTKVELYETIFEPDALSELSTFLGISFRPEVASQRVNDGAEKVIVSNRLLKNTASTGI